MSEVEASSGSLPAPRVRRFKMNGLDTLTDIRPRHCLKWSQGSAEWARACDEAYCRALEKAGYRRIK